MVIWTPKKGFTRCTSRSIWFNCIKRIDRRLDIVIIIATNFTPSIIFYLQIGVCLSLDLVKKKSLIFCPEHSQERKVDQRSYALSYLGVTISGPSWPPIRLCVLCLISSFTPKIVALYYFLTSFVLLT